jgi:hypothetical protein
MKVVNSHFKRHVGQHDKSRPDQEILDMHSLVAKFLADSDVPLAPNIFKQAIERAGGLSTLKIGDQDWTKHGYTDPYLFPANQCRNQTISDQFIFNEALSDFDIRKSKVYSVQQPGAPEEYPMLVDVLEQLQQPDPANAKYAMNLGQGRGVQRPSHLGVEPTISEMITGCNITPAGTLVDLHIGEYGS